MSPKVDVSLLLVGDYQRPRGYIFLNNSLIGSRTASLRVFCGHTARKHLLETALRRSTGRAAARNAVATLSDCGLGVSLETATYPTNSSLISSQNSAET